MITPCPPSLPLLMRDTSQAFHNTNFNNIVTERLRTALRSTLMSNFYPLLYYFLILWHTFILSSYHLLLKMVAVLPISVLLLLVSASAHLFSSESTRIHFCSVLSVITYSQRVTSLPYGCAQIILLFIYLLSEIRLANSL